MKWIIFQEKKLLKLILIVLIYLPKQNKAIKNLFVQEAIENYGLVVEFSQPIKTRESQHYEKLPQTKKRKKKNESFQIIFKQIPKSDKNCTKKK